MPARIAFLAALTDGALETAFALRAALARKALLADLTLLALLALRPSWTRFTVLESTQPGLNPRFETRDLRFELSNDRGGSRGHEFGVPVPLALLLFQRLGEADTPSVKEQVAAVRWTR